MDEIPGLSKGKSSPDSPHSHTNNEEPEIISMTKAVSMISFAKKFFHETSILYDALSSSLDNDGQEKFLKHLKLYEKEYTQSLQLFETSSLKLLHQKKADSNDFVVQRTKLKYEKWKSDCEADLKEIQLVLDYKENCSKTLVKSNANVDNKESSAENISITEKEEGCLPSLISDDGFKDITEKKVMISPMSESDYEYDEEEDIVKKKLNTKVFTGKHKRYKESKRNNNNDLISRENLFSSTPTPSDSTNHDISDFLDCSLSNEAAQTPERNRSTEATQTASPIFQPEDSRDQALLNDEEESKDVIPQLDIKIFDLEELRSNEFNHEARTPYSDINSNTALLQKENDKIVQNKDKAFVDQITSAMGSGFSSPFPGQPPEHHLGQHFLNSTVNNNFPTPSYSGSAESNVPTSSMQFISCPLCCALCENQEDMRNHLSVVHSPKVCTVCSYITQSLATFVTHVENEHSSLKVCQKCGEAFKREYFNAHFETHNNERLKSFKCVICSKAFKNEEKCKNHEKKHDSMFYKCCHCEHSSVSKYEDGKHRAEHLTESHREFQCKICYENFEKGEPLLGHMRMKHYMNRNKVPNYISCLICFNELTNEAALVQHVKNFHKHSAVVEKSAVDSGSGELKDKCPYCTMFIKSAKILATHIIVFHELAPFSCKCSKKFFSKGQLDLHILTHTKAEEVKFKLSNRGRKRKQ